MQTIHAVPQPVIARVHGIATAAGCQLVATCDLAIAAEEATFATPGVKIGLFCSTPMVAVSRAVGRKRAMEMLLTGTPIYAQTAADWGLVNHVVPAAGLDAAIDELCGRVTSSSAYTLAVGKAAFWEQIDRSEAGAYEHTQQVMAPTPPPPTRRRASAPSSTSARRTGRTAPEPDRCSTHEREGRGVRGGALGERGNIVEPHAAGRRRAGARRRPRRSRARRWPAPRPPTRRRGRAAPARRDRRPAPSRWRRRACAARGPRSSACAAIRSAMPHTRCTWATGSVGQRVAMGDRDGRVEHGDVAERGDGVESSASCDTRPTMRGPTAPRHQLAAVG